MADLGPDENRVVCSEEGVCLDCRLAGRDRESLAVSPHQSDEPNVLEPKGLARTGSGEDRPEGQWLLDRERPVRRDLVGEVRFDVGRAGSARVEVGRIARERVGVTEADGAPDDLSGPVTIEGPNPLDAVGEHEREWRGGGREGLGENPRGGGQKTRPPATGP